MENKMTIGKICEVYAYLYDLNEHDLTVTVFMMLDGEEVENKVCYNIADLIVKLLTMKQLTEAATEIVKGDD